MITKGNRISVSKQQLKIIKENWALFREMEDAFYKNVSALEDKMSRETGIKDLEFFCSDGDWCGIGNGSRTMRLIRRESLEGTPLPKNWGKIKIGKKLVKF